MTTVANAPSHIHPFTEDNSGRTKINDSAVAEICAIQTSIFYDSQALAFRRYFPALGQWRVIDDNDVQRELLETVRRVCDEHGQAKIAKRVGSSQLGALMRMMRICGSRALPHSPPGLVNLGNGTLDLRGDSPQLLAHSPENNFIHGIAADYAPTATCPMFLNELLLAALPAEDVRVIRMYLGSILLGRNSSQQILILRGEPGSGKGTLVRVLEGLLGKEQAAQLRIAQLTGRFEADAFYGKKLLLNSELSGDSMTLAGASQLKALVGGDRFDAETKRKSQRRALHGDFHVVFATNSQLRFVLDGDAEAWNRRLIVVDYARPRPKSIISDFDKLILAKERSGVLNWFIDGALDFRRIVGSHGAIHLSVEQRARVEGLVKGSNPIEEYVSNRLVKATGSSVSCAELLTDFVAYCSARRWQFPGCRKFQRELPDTILRRFRICPRHDLRQDGQWARGYLGIGLASDAGLNVSCVSSGRVNDNAS